MTSSAAVGAKFDNSIRRSINVVTHKNKYPIIV